MTEAREVKLKPCPLGDHKALEVSKGRVKCSRVGCPLNDDNAVMAVRVWNTRPAEQELVDALREALRVTDPFRKLRGGEEELDWRVNAVAVLFTAVLACVGLLVGAHTASTPVGFIGYVAGFLASLAVAVVAFGTLCFVDDCQ